MAARKPMLGFRSLWNISFGFFGIQIAFALEGANVSRIFQTLGASVDQLPILWIAAPATGLIVQPIIGHFSDRTWGRLGRRRPYFLAGAILCALAMAGMPIAPALWVAAVLLWVMDACINISMEPFRAFVGDMLDERQRTQGYAVQTIFIGAGAVAASLAPALLTDIFHVSNVAPEGIVPATVRYSFYGGAAALIGAVLWTVLSTKEYSPEQMAAFGEGADEDAPRHAIHAPSARQGAVWLVVGLIVIAAVALLGLDKPLYILGFGLGAFGLAQIVNRWRVAQGKTESPLNHILSDLASMPPTMRRLALIQFLSWFGLFILWIYATPVVTQYQFGATDPASKLYNEGANWVGVLFAVYNGVAALYAMAMPAIARRIGQARLHAINLVIGGAAFASFALIRDPDWLLVSMVGVGMAWASILTIPYAILCGSLDQTKLGVYMGLFNIFIVAPQLVVSTVMGSLAAHVYPHEQVISFVIGGGFMVAAALCTLRLKAVARGCEPVAKVVAA